MEINSSRKLPPMLSNMPRERLMMAVQQGRAAEQALRNQGIPVEPSPSFPGHTPSRNQEADAQPIALMECDMNRHKPRTQTSLPNRTNTPRDMPQSIISPGRSNRSSGYYSNDPNDEDNQPLVTRSEQVCTQVEIQPPPPPPVPPSFSS